MKVQRTCSPLLLTQKKAQENLQGLLHLSLTTAVVTTSTTKLNKATIASTVRSRRFHLTLECLDLPFIPASFSCLSRLLAPIPSTPHPLIPLIP